MSENIKITIVTQDDKLNNTIDASEDKSVIVTHDSSVTIMSTLLKNGLINGSFCGGRGDCGRCRIQFLEGVTVPSALERRMMEAEELRQGYRLACFAKPKSDCTIRLALTDVPEIAIVSNVIDVTESIDLDSQQNSKSENRRLNVMESEDSISLWNEKMDNKTDVMIAVDLGTTTIAMQLVAMNTGRVLDIYCEMNPQRRYGADVLSRIQASCEGNRDILQRLVIEVLERGVAYFGNQTDCVKCMCIAGNTTMEHLFMGYDVTFLGHSPFTPVEIGLQEYEYPGWDFTVWLVPGISTFVGGDIVAGLYARGMLSERLRKLYAERKGHAGQGLSLLIDLGTNGEMAIKGGTRTIVTATAAGPAFEGGAGAGIVGSDMIKCTAELLRQRIMDETGLLAEPFFQEGVSIQIVGEEEYRFTPGRGDSSLYLTQKDVRALQMAKAAVRAGVEVLLKRMGGKQSDETERNRAQQVMHVYLAGGFGYYLDVEAAFYIGLLPEHMRGSVTAVGNTSLMGAWLIGRDLWQHKIDKQALEQSISSIESINLAQQEDFEQLYIQYMNFPVC